jgi:hypothetical protein
MLITKNMYLSFSQRVQSRTRFGQETGTVNITGRWSYREGDCIELFGDMDLGLNGSECWRQINMVGRWMQSKRNELYENHFDNNQAVYHYKFINKCFMRKVFFCVLDALYCAVCMTACGKSDNGRNLSRTGNRVNVLRINPFRYMVSGTDFDCNIIY